MIPLIFGAVAAAVAAAAMERDDSEKGSSKETTSKEAASKETTSKEVPSEDWEVTLGEWSVELGRRIETARVLQRMTQEKCAAEAKISRTALRNLEDGKDTKLSTLFAVSNALSLPMTAIFKGMQQELEKALAETLGE